MRPAGGGIDEQANKDAEVDTEDIVGSLRKDQSLIETVEWMVDGEEEEDRPIARGVHTVGDIPHFLARDPS